MPAREELADGVVERLGRRMDRFGRGLIAVGLPEFEGTPGANRDPAGARQQMGPGERVDRPDDRAGDDRRARAQGETRGAVPERCERTVLLEPPFGEQDHALATLEGRSGSVDRSGVVPLLSRDGDGPDEPEHGAQCPPAGPLRCHENAERAKGHSVNHDAVEG